MPVEYLPMTIEDYDDVISLWRSVDGVGLHDDVDSREGIMEFLERNPGFSLVAKSNGRLVGAVLCGHDGRRGCLNHLAVAPEHRGRGIGRRLADRCLSQLKAAGIPKCNIMVYAHNDEGRLFWDRLGWSPRGDLVLMQKQTG